MVAEKSPDRLVAAYLRSRGYTRTEDQLREEARDSSGGPTSFDDLLRANQEVSIPDSILFYSEAEARNVNAYEDSFRQLLDWVNGSIEKYKLELRQVLFPLFLYSYLDLIAKGVKDKATAFFDLFRREFLDAYPTELRTLATIVEPQHVQENELAQQFLRTRFAIPLSRYSFELLLSFFQENKFLLLLRILNEHVNITVTKTGPRDPSLLNRAVAGVSNANEKLIDIPDDKLEVPPFPLPADLPFMEELEYAVKQEAVALEPESKEKVDNDKLLADVAKMREETAKRITTDKKEVENNNKQTTSQSFSKLPAKLLADVPSTLAALKEIRSRVALSPQSLPSIAMYTMHNTYGSLNSLNFSEDGSLVAAGFADSTIQLYNVAGGTLGRGNATVNADETGTVSARLVGHAGPVYGTSFSADRRYMVSCSEDRTTRLWSLDTLTNVVCFKGHNYPVWDVDFSPQGWYFATASYEGTARLWSCDHPNALRMYVGHLSDVECVRFHPGGSLLATGSTDRTARLWDVQSGACIRVFVKHTAPVCAIAVAPDGRRIATAAADSSVIVWDIGTGKPLKELRRHTDAVHSLAFSRDGTILATGGGDQVVRLWDVGASGDGGSTGCGEGDVVAGDAAVTSATGVVSAGGTITDGVEHRRRGGLLGAYPTRRTPVLALRFTRGNVLQAAGAFVPPQ